MPYADKRRQLAYNRSWAKTKRDTASRSPMANDVMAILRAASPRPLRPADILVSLRKARPTATPISLSVCLSRMKHGGRVASLGYGKWVPVLTTESGNRKTPELADWTAKSGDTLSAACPPPEEEK